MLICQTLVNGDEVQCSMALETCPLHPSRMYLWELEVKEHFLTFPTYSGSSLHLAVLGLILHLEVY